DAKILGNERLISQWPARGGPVVLDDTVYFAAGVWPSDGVYVHAVDAESGESKWSNGKTGGLYMPQPHSGANAKSGVSPQGYLLASAERLFAPTGRAVPAAFHRSDGELLYYHLQENQQRGGTWAMLADRFLVNSGCLFEQDGGGLAAKHGFGPMAATPEGILWANGRSLNRCRWQDVVKLDRKGQPIKTRVLEEIRLIQRDRQVTELIVAGEQAVCGEEGRVSAVDYTRQRNTWWSHKVEGSVYGLAAAGGRIIASTDRGRIYCFDGELPEPAGKPILEQSAQKPTSVDYSQAADEIVRKAKIQNGFCVDLSAGGGDLALELARRTKLRVYAVELDSKQVVEARRKLVK
ncbi:MAG: PQQ-binding-like beta-propeller repeat protein, partial [Planctomycetales bacterium]